MNNSALQWLVSRASLPGTLACGLRAPDGQLICHSVNDACPASIVEKILGRFDNLAAAAITESSLPHWSTWAFEQGQVRLVERPDGWRLALVVRTGTDAVPALDQLSQEFLTTQLES
ncbi:MAG TPA: hypothetical protein VHC44_12170 [Verrucomicrobiae bacterium]|nr:hypothetical protein [Verrucomicrobiae bacterium]